MYHFIMTVSWMDRAKTLMQSRGISQEELAASLSCTRGAIGHYLSGRRSPSLEQLARLAEALQTDPAWLVFGERYAGIGEPDAGYAYTGTTITLMTEVRPEGNRGGGTLSLPPATPDNYAVLINSNDYEPRIHAGEAVLVDPGIEPAAGDEVIVNYKNQSIKLHTFLKSAEDYVTIDSIVGEKQVRTLTKRDYRMIHKIVAIFRPGVAIRSEE